MFPNKNVNISQFYSVPSPAYSHHPYPYSLYVQPSHSMNIVSQTQKNTPAPYLDEGFTNGFSLSSLGTNNGESFSQGIVLRIEIFAG